MLSPEDKLFVEAVQGFVDSKDENDIAAHWFGKCLAIIRKQEQIIIDGTAHNKEIRAGAKEWMSNKTIYLEDQLEKHKKALERAKERAIGGIESSYFAMNKEYLAKDVIELFNKELSAILNE